MSLVTRVQDAEFLWEHGRREGAFLTALVAFAATARRIRPKPVGDRKAFEEFFRERLGQRLSFEFRGQQVGVETLFYKWLRCELVHEGGLPVDVRFVDDTDGAGMMIRAGGAPDFTLLVATTGTSSSPTPWSGIR